ncbi:hypothetical protein ABZ924_02545 [Streptomyces sp. NPDC046876]|uniref:hypothetical protein n=1 Tax=Streptomyces sp. NPDC046876 TaxID=3155616 RepID=UPI0033EEB522
MQSEAGQELQLALALYRNPGFCIEGGYRSEEPDRHARRSIDVIPLIIVFPHPQATFGRKVVFRMT